MEATREQKIIGGLVEETGRKIKNGECGLTKEEMKMMCRIALHEEWFLADLERRFGCSSRTIERYCKDGLLPPLRHRSDNRKFLYHDEVELWVLEHGEPH